MKISKVFTGLIVCGALIFPGASSSSAQEIDPSKSAITVKYTGDQPTWNGYKWFETHQGLSTYVTHVLERPAPYAPAVYGGWCNYMPGESRQGTYVYRGILYLTNPIK